MFNSCKKTEQISTPQTHYRAILVNNNSRLPLINHKVYLYRISTQRITETWEISQTDTSLVMPNIPYGTVDSTLTDDNGYFEFLFPSGIDSSNFLENYWPSLGNEDSFFCYTTYLVRVLPARKDTFWIEPRKTLNLKMQKVNGSQSTDDILIENITLHTSNGIFISRRYSKGQIGKANHIIEIPYSEHFSDWAEIRWQYKDPFHSQIGTDTIVLNGVNSTNYTIRYN